MRIISASIDVTKIDKDKLVVGKNGAKYYNFDIIVNDEENQFGKDVSLVQQQTKEQRTAKEKRVFIGGGKTVFKKEPEQEQTHYTAPVQEVSNSEAYNGDDLPF